MISDFGEGGWFSKIEESLYKKAFSIGRKSEMGGGGGRGGFKNDPQISYIIYGWPLVYSGSSGATSGNLVASSAAAAVAATARLSGLMRTSPKMPQETTLAATTLPRVSSVIAERRGSTSPPQQPPPPPSVPAPSLLPGKTF